MVLLENEELKHCRENNQKEKMKPKKGRVFLKTNKNNLKKLYSIIVDEKNKFFLVQSRMNVICRLYGLPLGSEIHYHCPQNGKDYHLSIKSCFSGPFENPEILREENFYTFFANKDEYKHKKIKLMKINSINPTDNKEAVKPLPKEIKDRLLLSSNWIPEPFDKYLRETSQFPFYDFPSAGTHISRLSNQELERCSWDRGDRTKTPPTDNDIIIEESNEPNIHITIGAFLCTPGHFSPVNNRNYKLKLIRTPSMPDCGISVIFY